MLSLYLPISLLVLLPLTFYLSKSFLIFLHSTHFLFSLSTSALLLSPASYFNPTLSIQGNQRRTRGEKFELQGDPVAYPSFFLTPDPLLSHCLVLGTVESHALRGKKIVMTSISGPSVAEEEATSTLSGSSGDESRSKKRRREKHQKISYVFTQLNSIQLHF